MKVLEASGFAVVLAGRMRWVWWRRELEVG